MALMTTHNDDLGDDLVITRVSRRAAGSGTWVCGTLAGHRFEALVGFLSAGLAEHIYATNGGRP